MELVFAQALSKLSLSRLERLLDAVALITLRTHFQPDAHQSRQPTPPGAFLRRAQSPLSAVGPAVSASLMGGRGGTRNARHAA